MAGGSSTMSYIDPRELNDLADLASRGGIGKGTATTDCVAEAPDQLMFISGDELVLLRQLPEVDIASCEGVVGWVKKGSVDFELEQSVRDDLPRTVLTAPSPPTHTVDMPDVPDDSAEHLKRVSGPFEFESPQQSPNIEQAEQAFFEQQKRESVASVASSEAYGGIGGFMMGESPSGDFPPEVEELAEGSEAEVTPTAETSPGTAPLQTPSSPTLPSPAHSTQSSASGLSDWDIYGDYARESMYGPRRMSLAAKRASRKAERFSIDSENNFGAIHAARIAVEAKDGGEEVQRPTVHNSERPETPKAEERARDLADFTGRSLATELRLKIQRERAETRETEENGDESPRSLAGSSKIHSLENQPSSSSDSNPLTFGSSPGPAPSPADEEPAGTRTARPSISVETKPQPSESHESDESAQSIQLHTPIPADNAESSVPQIATLMASPMPLDEGPKLTDPLEVPSPNLDVPTIEETPLSPLSSLAPPQNWSPAFKVPHAAWSPNSPASPHSVAATRQAVEAARSTPQGRPRGLTLVGRMEADLSASKGPVPISFVIGGPEMPKHSPIGLGLPSGRSTPEHRPMTPGPIALTDDLETIRSAPSKYPTPTRSVTTPVPPVPNDRAAGPRSGFQAARPRSRSFSSAVAKAVSKKKDLSVDTSVPALPSAPSTKRGLFGRKSSTPAPARTPPASPGNLTLNANSSTPSLSSTFSFKGAKTPKKTSKVLPSPVSHKDYEDTINAGGMDFELVQPKKLSSAPQSPASQHGSVRTGMTTTPSINSFSSRVLVDTDEWGFVKELSTIPEIYSSRSAPGDHRATEQKWLSIISSPLPAGGPPKKVRKLVLDAGIPSSLRGKTWAWFMAPAMSARVSGLYDELCSHDKPSAADSQIEQDIERLWSDHSSFHMASSPGRADLKAVLRAYSNFSPSGYSTPMCHLAGTLLVHSVAEDAFWLLTGLVNTVLRDYYSKDARGSRLDAGVFEGVLKGSEKELAAMFREVGIRAVDFIGRWHKQLFVRYLPWPTAMRVIDAVVSEGPRFLLVTSLTILTLSRERLLALPRNKEAILGYLESLPQDSVLLPENFMRASEKVKFRDEDWKRLRIAVEKELGP